MLSLAVSGACTTASVPVPLSARPPTQFVIPAELPNGRVEFSIAPVYPVGATLTVPVTIIVARGTVTGPITARVLASGINEAGAPAEVPVRELAVIPVSSGPGRRTLSLIWDARDVKGSVVPADAYSLVLELRSEDGGSPRTVRAGVTLELR